MLSISNMEPTQSGLDGGVNGGAMEAPTSWTRPDDGSSSSDRLSDRPNIVVTTAVDDHNDEVDEPLSPVSCLGVPEPFTRQSSKLSRGSQHSNKQMATDVSTSGSTAVMDNGCFGTYPPSPPRAFRRQDSKQSRVSQQSLFQELPNFTFESIDSTISGDLSHHHASDGSGAHDVELAISPQDDKPVLEEVMSPVHVEDSWMEHAFHAVYISVFAVFGTIFRVYMGRFFGLDCELQSAAPNDHLSVMTRNICITASGTTVQTGGALFIDLPANMLGSLIMGTLSPSGELYHPIPRFRADHQLQRHESFHTGLKVGFCGCLTTFASWNTQMIVMMVGTHTVLGSQVAAALFGYLLGISCAAASFAFGRHIHEWLRAQHPPAVPTIDIIHEDQYMNNASQHKSDASVTRHSRISERMADGVTYVFGIRFGPFVLLSVLFALFIYGDAQGELFYRKMWMACVLTPPGAILRWHWSKWNSQEITFLKRWKWVPWGTLAANLVAAAVSVLCSAILTRYIAPTDSRNVWTSSIVAALAAGFAGSLSTVSTLIREVFDLLKKQPSHAHFYYLGTILSAMFLCLILYIPIVRS